MLASFFASLAEILKNLPQHPIAFFGTLAVLLSFVALVFFGREERAWLKLTAFMVLFLGAGGVSLAALRYSIGESDKSPLPPPINDLSSAVDPNKLPFEFLPNNIEILVFDATRQKRAGAKLARCLRLGGDERTVDFQRNWMNEWEMEVTRIYYQGSSNEEFAGMIASVLPGRQFVFDYENQRQYVNDESLWRDAPPGSYRNMAGINRSRDIIIFAGADISDWVGLPQNKECGV